MSKVKEKKTSFFKDLDIRDYLFLIYCFIIPFESWDAFGIGSGFSIVKMVGYLYVLAVMRNLNIFLKFPYAVRKPIRYLFFFYGLFFLMNLINANYQSHDFIQLPILQNAIMFVFLSNHERIKPGIIEKGFGTYILGAILLIILYNFGVAVDDSTSRHKMLDENQNVLAIKVAIAVLSLLGIAVKLKNKKIKYLSFTILFLFFFPAIDFIFDTGSRTATLIILIGVGLTLFLISGRNVILKTFGLFLGIGFGIYFYDLVMSSEVMGQRIEQEEKRGQFSNRTFLWEYAVQYIEDHPFFGGGRTGYDAFMIKAYGNIQSPHNVFLEILAYTGIIGMFLFLGFLFLCVKSSYKYYLKTKIVIPLILFIPLIGMMLSQQMLRSKIAWLIIVFGATRSFYLNRK